MPIIKKRLSGVGAGMDWGPSHAAGDREGAAAARRSGTPSGDQLRPAACPASPPWGARLEAPKRVLTRAWT